MQRYLAAFCLCLVWVTIACGSGDIEINVLYERISGLTVDDAVILKGGEVGRVTALQYTREGAYAVQLRLEKNFANAITEHARFFIVDNPDRSGKKAVQIRHVQAGGRQLASGATIDGAYEGSELSRRLQKEIETGMRLFSQTIEKLKQDIQQFDESDAYRDMRKTLEDLADELSRKEKAARESFKRKWLPKIQRELEALREKLRQSGREKEMAPLDSQLERLRRI